MIRNIIFDMGNVLLHFDRELFLTRLGIQGEDRQVLTREVFRSLEWVRMDRGSLTEPEAVERICARLPQRLHGAAESLVCRWDQPIVPMAGMEELVRELKGKGYGIYLLSNASFRQREYWPRVPGSDCFDGVFLSCDHRLVKPQPEIYTRMLSQFSLRAEECVFIDDVPANIEGAYQCGIRGIVFHADAVSLRRELRALGVSA